MAHRTHLEKTRVFGNVILTVLALFFAFFALKLNSEMIRLKPSPTKISVDSAKAASFRWHPLLFRMLSFGQIPSSVDYLLLRFITDDVTAKVSDGRETEVYRILDLATEIDPAFMPLYTGGANFLAIVRNDKNGAVNLMLKGERFLENQLKDYPDSFKDRFWPDRWRIDFILGYLYLFELDRFDLAMKSYSKMEPYPGLPESLALKVANARSIAGQSHFALNSIEILKKWNADDPRILEELEVRRKTVIENVRLLKWNELFLNERLKRSKKRDLASFFTEFKRIHQIPDRDELGGVISLAPDGEIQSTTRRVLTPIAPEKTGGATPLEKPSSTR